MSFKSLLPRAPGFPAQPYVLIAVILMALVAGQATDSHAEEVVGEENFSTGLRDLGLIKQLERDQIRIRSIVINRVNVFDQDIKKENRLPNRLANSVHVVTRDATLRNQLLFRTGDLVNRSQLEETERLLRASRYIYSAEISVGKVHEDGVDILVSTQDVWTLKFGVSGRRSGGVNSSGVELEETNLFGTGIAVSVAQKSTLERDSTQYGFDWDNVFGSRYEVSVSSSKSKDGHAVAGHVGLPFYSLDSTSALGLSVTNQSLVDEVYDRANSIGAYRHKKAEYELMKGWSSGLVDGWAKRRIVGLRYTSDEFDTLDLQAPSPFLPQARTYAYPFFGLEFVQNSYAVTKNVTQIQQVEDIHTGAYFYGEIGLAPGFTSDGDSGLLAKFSARRSFGSSDGHRFLLGSELSGRWSQTAPVTAKSSFTAQYFWKQSPRFLYFAQVQTDFSSNGDLDEQVYLGGDTGLRGYPLRYQRGESRAVLTMEQRYFSDWQPFSLFNVGAAAFVDVGRAWNDSTGTTDNSDVLVDAGFGLRLGSRRSSSGRMVHIDLAFPLVEQPGIDGMQLVIGTKKHF